MFTTTSNHKKNGSPVLCNASPDSHHNKTASSSSPKGECGGSSSPKVPVSPNGIVKKIDLKDENRLAGKQKNKKKKIFKIPFSGCTIKDLEASEMMAAWCFDLLISKLKGNQSTPTAPSILRRLAEDGAKCSVFVTWMKKRSGHEHISFDKARTELRGCIGCLEPIPILDLGEYAIKSGLRDHRFQPISANELRHLICQISLLGCFEKCDHAYQWDIGTHGVIVNFSDVKGRRYSATFLPEIAEENKMSHRVTIHELIRKSQFIGPITDTLLENVEVTRYQSSKIEL
ncbi:DUF51 family protein, partial [Cardiosporidium cionae]